MMRVANSAYCATTTTTAGEDGRGVAGRCSSVMRLLAVIGFTRTVLGVFVCGKEAFHGTGQRKKKNAEGFGRMK